MGHKGTCSAVVEVPQWSQWAGALHRERYESNKWVLGACRKKSSAPRFDNVVDLVEYYKKHELPGRIVMKTAIYRPKWLIKHDMCSFDMITDLIGTGNFCKVYKGTYERDKNDIIPVAIKICHGASTETVTEESKKARESMIHEAQLMSHYAHRHVIQLYGVACDHYPVMIVMEYCPGGNLQDHMHKFKNRVLIPERILLLWEACKGMRYLHSKGCVHRDLAARNCLISELGYIKISDFGLSKIAEELEMLKKGEDKSEPQIEHIPLRWMAPETLRRPQLWSTKSDVWSFGILIYEVFNDGEKPWVNDEPKRIATHIRDTGQDIKGRMPDLPLLTPQLVKQLVAKIWVLNPDIRPTMDDLYKQLKAFNQSDFMVILISSCQLFNFLHPHHS
ncbi:protein tyrosine kinase [Dictyocaulus viviparus]|uniref:Protein tyrosine kinase n=1 Tax=Dictyocaulus viviparus TaxID=29172 RepID=A0A0D8X7B4_DICVI|nr:protein tyrosine kinase [Dictyocaulus viviparus]